MNAVPRPTYLPEKFWDQDKGEARTEAMAKSYADMERRAAHMVRVPGEDASAEDVAQYRRAMGIPENAEGYEITFGDDLIESDAEVNKALHAAGFSQAQTQMVYDLAKDKLMPLIEDAAAEFEGQRQTERLVHHFGGDEKWQEASRQLTAWGKINLPPHVLDALSTTYEGVLTLHRMMDSGEPAFVTDGAGTASSVVEEAELKRMMDDPKYWRDHDPALIAKVTAGFQRLYGDGE
ncbi:MAG: hypothetical protein ISR48_01310 [Alphaproteobacteria bacterium]|nr:hypothetical protein [Alphaproteobacteria bacterium]